jgi:hypothetical protein
VDEISYGPKRNLRLPTPPGPPWLWKAAAAVAALTVAAAVFAAPRFSGQHHSASSRESAAMATVGLADPPPEAVPGPPPYPEFPAPGTVLLACDPPVTVRLEPRWRAGSLRAGPVWFVAARQLGYVRLGRAPGAGRTPPEHSAPVRDVNVEVLVHVDAGPSVALRAAPEALPYFKFLDSPGDVPPRGFPVPVAPGFTFMPCPRTRTDPPDLNGFYQFDFSITPGYSAAVEILTPAAHPIWLTFTAGGRA